MTVWCTTVLPALLHLAKEAPAQIFYVFEDTALLAPDVDYKKVARQTEGVEAGLFWICLSQKGRAWLGSMVWVEGYLCHGGVVPSDAGCLAKHKLQ